LLLALLSCASHEAVDPPDRMLRDGTLALSTLFVIVRGGALESIDAIALDHPIYPEIHVGSRDTIQLYAFLYSGSLSSMNMQAGLQRIAGDTDTGSYILPETAIKKGGVGHLPASAALYTMQLPSSAPMWAAQDPSSLPPSVLNAKLDVPPVERCVDFTARSVSLDTRADALIGIGIDPHDVFAGTRDGHFFNVTSTVAVRYAGLSTNTPYLGGYRGPAGDIWLAGDQGQIVHGHPDSGFSAVDHTATRGGNDWVHIDGPDDATAPFELFVATDSGTLDRFDGNAWHALVSREPTPTELDWAVSVAWAAPGEVFAIGPSVTTIIHVRSGQLSDEPFGSGDQIATTVAIIRGFGPVLGTNTGRLYRYNGTVWSEIPGTSFHLPVTTIAALDDGILFGGKDGVLAEWFPALGYCPTFDAAPFDVRAMVPFEGGYMLFSSSTHETTISPAVIMSPKN
jgi:hypothetical protein